MPVFCSRETWKAWWEENAGGNVVKSEQSGEFVSEIIFTGFPSERDGSPKFWTIDARNTKTDMRYSLGSFATLEEAIAFPVLKSTKGPSSEKLLWVGDSENPTVGFIQYAVMRTKTVGGPVEVAVITKHEGFKWVQRKHFFS